MDHIYHVRNACIMLVFPTTKPARDQKWKAFFFPSEDSGKDRSPRAAGLLQNLRAGLFYKKTSPPLHDSPPPKTILISLSFSCRSSTPPRRNSGIPRSGSQGKAWPYSHCSPYPGTIIFGVDFAGNQVESHLPCFSYRFSRFSDDRRGFYSLWIPRPSSPWSPDDQKVE